MQTVAAAAFLALVVAAPVHLTLTVAQSCTIVTPTAAGTTDDGKPVVSLDAVIPDCHAQGVSATLRVERASLSEGSYVATIDF